MVGLSNDLDALLAVLVKSLSIVGIVCDRSVAHAFASWKSLYLNYGTVRSDAAHVDSSLSSGRNCESQPINVISELLISV